MVILRRQNKITDFFMILAWVGAFNRHNFPVQIFENNTLSISINLICTDRRVHIAPISVQPDMKFNLGEYLQNKATSLLSSCLVVQSGL